MIEQIEKIFNKIVFMLAVSMGFHICQIISNTETIEMTISAYIGALICFLFAALSFDTGFIKESQITNKQQLQSRISEFRESLEWYRKNVDNEILYANGFINKLDEIEKLTNI